MGMGGTSKWPSGLGVPSCDAGPGACGDPCDDTERGPGPSSPTRASADHSEEARSATPEPPEVHERPSRPRLFPALGPAAGDTSLNGRVASVLSTSGGDTGTASEVRAVRRTGPVSSRQPRGPARPPGSARKRRAPGHHVPCQRTRHGLVPTFDLWVRGVLRHFVTDAAFALTSRGPRRPLRAPEQALGLDRAALHAPRRTNENAPSQTCGFHTP